MALPAPLLAEQCCQLVEQGIRRCHAGARLRWLMMQNFVVQAIDAMPQQLLCSHVALPSA